MERRVVGHIDLVLFVALVAFGGYVIVCKPWGIGTDESAAAALAGALFGGAAVLLGNWINRANDRFKAAREEAGQLEKLKIIIAAELVDVAAGLLSAKELVDSAIASLRAGGPVAEALDMSAYRPRQMPFTDDLGTKLLILEKGAIDAIVTLRSNLEVTRKSMDDVTAGARFGLLKATSLSDGIGRDMKVLAETISYIAPNRRLLLGDAEPELVTEILKRKAKPPVDDRRPAAR
ncbi:hypothetical protein OEJ37_05325 [Burkholderia sp. BKH01]|uniref:hypothetical protein n=1 Tax=Burkholderia sp. BKH01 TaxID=2769262 RepID=UPI0021E0B880|nr:hypothetical protein [Burkholderia sp. BKH01]MCU9952783.1 hypothetical protein [Burkholderia sp. BKH01]